MRYVTYTCAETFQTYCTALSNYENLYDWGFLALLLVGRQDTSPGLLLVLNLRYSIAVRVG